MEQKCTTCGAPASGKKCDYCGKRIRKNQNEDRATASYNMPPLNDMPTINSGEYAAATNEYPPYSNQSSNNNRSIFIAIAVVISVVAAGAFLVLSSLYSSNLDAYELLQQSNNVIGEIGSNIIDFQTDIEITTLDTSLYIPMNGRIHSEIISETEANLMMEMEMEMTGFDTPSTTSMFFRDGYMYTDLSGERTRKEMTLEHALAVMEGWVMFDIDVNKDIIIDSSAKSTRDGYLLTFELNTEAMLDVMGEYAEGVSTTDVDDGTFNLTIYLDHHYQQVSSIFDVEFEFSEMGTSTVMSLSMWVDVEQVEDVNIVFPSWLDSVDAIEFVDPADAPFIGNWDNGYGMQWLFVFEESDSVEFLPDGTVIIYEGNSEVNQTWRLGEDNVLRVAGREFTWEVSGDNLIITDSWGDNRTFRRDGATNNDSDKKDSELIGYWDNGSGRIPLWVFGSADSVEFRENGTVIITEGRTSYTVDWRPVGPGFFTADDRTFTYSIDGDTVTITDSAEDNWTFERVD